MIMKKLKIAFFADVLIKNFDGAIRTIYQILERLPEDEFELKVFCGVPPDHDFPYPVYSITSITLPINKNYKMALPHLNKINLKRELDNFCPDIIHISTPSLLGNFALNYAKKNDIKVSTIYHTHFISYVDFYLRKARFLIKPTKLLLGKTLDSFYTNCDIIFTPTKEMINHLKSIGVREKQLVFWPRGIDKSIFSPTKRNPAELQKITANHDPKVIFASRLVWEKNLDTLINIYHALKSTTPNINFIVCGDGVAKKALESKMPDACFTGTIPQERLATLLASSDVFVFPSISETYGNVVAEAMSCGTPCVIANGGGSREFINNGGERIFG